MNNPDRHLRVAVAAALFAGLCASAGATDITLSNAWMRPVRAGTPAAGVYVDVRTDVPLKLVGAKSPVARSAVIVLVVQNPDGTSTETPVKEFELAGGAQTRFALNGNYIQLREIQEDLRPGIDVPLTLEFAEPKTNVRHTIEIGALVRGVILPPPAEPDAKQN